MSVHSHPLKLPMQNEFSNVFSPALFPGKLSAPPLFGDGGGVVNK